MSPKNIFKNIAPLNVTPSTLKPILKKLDHIKAVLFDVYGTLLISRRLDKNPWRTNPNEPLPEALSQTQISRAQFADLVDQFYEAVKKEHQEVQLEDNCPEVNMLEIWVTLLAPWSEMVNIQQLVLEYEIKTHPTWPMPNTALALADLKSKNYLMGILSNSQFYTKVLLEHYLNSPLEQLGFSEDIQFYSYQYKIAKPDRAFFQLAIDHLAKTKKIKPGEIVYIGNDMVNDIIPAKELGLKAILFSGDEQNTNLHPNITVSTHHQPDAIITNFSQLNLLL